MAKTITCGHSDRRHKARGLCGPCYAQDRWANGYFQEWAVDRKTTCGHAPYFSSDLCRACYDVRRRRAAGMKSKKVIRTCGHLDGTRGGRALCASCSDRKRRNGPDRVGILARRRETEYRRRFGLSVEERDSYVSRSGIACCDVCGSVDPGSRLGWATDHDHDHCGRDKGCLSCIRAVLCMRCNVLEGALKRAVTLGIVTLPVHGPLGILFGPIADTPFQVWRREIAV